MESTTPCRHAVLLVHAGQTAQRALQRRTPRTSEGRQAMTTGTTERGSGVAQARHLAEAEGGEAGVPRAGAGHAHHIGGLQQLALVCALQRAQLALVGRAQLAGLLAQRLQLGQLAAVVQAQVARLRGRSQTLTPMWATQTPRFCPRPPRLRSCSSLCSLRLMSLRVRRCACGVHECHSKGCNDPATLPGGGARLVVQGEGLDGGRDGLTRARHDAHDPQPRQRDALRQLVHRHVAGRRHQHLHRARAGASVGAGDMPL